MNNNNIQPVNNGNAVTKKKRKFNFIDFLILLLIVALVGTLIYAFSPWSQLKRLWTANETSIQYVVEIKGVDAEFITLIENGDSVINSVTKSSLGTVNKIDPPQQSSELYYAWNEEKLEYQGEMIVVPNKYDIIVYITATAEYKQDVGYTVNGTRIAVGEELSLRFPDFSHNGYCIAIATDS